MSTSEWNTEDNHPVSLPNMVSSSDLFDGELFGDELIDIYNSTVDDGTDIQGIATLDPPLIKANVDSHHPGAPIPDHPGAHLHDVEMHDETGAQIAATVAALDDGLGAFRPSTSFNDLSTLIQNQEEVAGTTVEVASELPTSTTTSTAPASASAPKTSKKRNAPATAECPPAKQKCNSRSRRQSSSTKKQAVPQTKKNRVVLNGTASCSNTTAPAVVTPSGTTSEIVVNEAPCTVVTSGNAVSQPSGDQSGTSKKIDPIPSDSSVGSSGNTESQFKSIAQQAVSNLIMNAAGTTAVPAPVKDAEIPKDESSEDESKSKVDTSTAHIKALTGNNWVAACSGSVSSAAPVPQPPVEPKSASSNSSTNSTTANSSNNNNNNRVRRQNLTPDERARQNRDRNREHARNTRLRKKAYVEELKRTLTELVAQRDAVDLEKRQAAQREVEQREVRFRVMEEFMKLRGRNESNFARWVAILEDGFVLTVPVASFCKKTPGAEVDGFEQKLNSVETVMAESSVFSKFLQTLGPVGENAVTLNVICDRSNFFMDGCNAVLDWTATSTGGKAELKIKGQIRGKFSPASNKLESASILLDCGSVIAQIQAMSNFLTTSGDEIDVTAAQADALLDSLKIDDVHLNVVVPSDVSVVIPSNSAASVITEKGVDSSDECSSIQDANSKGDGTSGDRHGMTTRRVARRE